MGEGVGAATLEIRWPGKASEGVRFELRPEWQGGADLGLVCEAQGTANAGALRWNYLWQCEGLAGSAESRTIFASGLLASSFKTLDSLARSTEIWIW